MAQDLPAPVIGIDLGGTNMQAAVVDGESTIIGRSHRRTEPEHGFEHVLDGLVACVRDACDDAAIDPQAVGAIGIAAAGAIDVPNGIVLDAPNLRWTDAPLRQALQDRLGIDVVLDNDVNGAAWGEHRLGAGRGRGDMLGIWIGTGIGGGLVLGGQLHHGDFFTAGELGHMIAYPGQPRGRRSLEDFASRTGMLRTIRERFGEHPSAPITKLCQGDPERIDMRMLAEAYEANDPLVGPVIDDGATLIGTLLASVVTLLAIDTIVVGGGVAEALGEPYLQRIRAAFDEHVFPDRCRRCELLMTTLRSEAGLLGAALLARMAAHVPA